MREMDDLKLGATPNVEFGREICGDFSSGQQREWLVTNGIGGFASGTIPGLPTRRYHGLLTAALTPPLGRTLLVARVAETFEYAGTRYPLSCIRWHDGTIDPHGYRYLERFLLDGTRPVWLYCCADALLEKSIWMEQGANTTYVRYRLVRGSAPARLTASVFVNYRDYHSLTRAGQWRMEVGPGKAGIRVQAFDQATPFYLLSESGRAEPRHEWHYGFDLATERYRGLPAEEDHLHAAEFEWDLDTPEPSTLVFTTDPESDLSGSRALHSRRQHEARLLQAWDQVLGDSRARAPAWIRQLVLAADQFVVERTVEGQAGRTIIAGYPWFGDWGRDTMIALPGLTLSVGRPREAGFILRTFARFVDQGMLPNLFPDAGSVPEYNTVDAALWYFETVRQYWEATRDKDLVEEIYEALAQIIDWSVRGTRYGIRMDPADGLLRAGVPGVQLTWMDAKVGDWVVTPRIGKPIEVNALWLNALHIMSEISRALNRPARQFEELAGNTAAGFRRFWNEGAGYCFDVLDGPEGSDSSLRPNQIFAVSLPVSPLSREQQKAVVDTCALHLLTSHGLRSLAPNDPRYQGRYGGTPLQRDGAYHQGTVWGWLLGPFALAHYRVYGDAGQARSFLRPMADHIRAHGLGSASEIFDGDAPHHPRGCIAQAWTVAELIRCWLELEKAAAASAGSSSRLPDSQPALRTEAEPVV